MSQRAEQLEARRNLVRDQAAELGIRVELLPSGVYHPCITCAGMA